MQNVIIQCVKRTTATCLGKVFAGGIGEELETQAVSAICELYQRGPRCGRSLSQHGKGPKGGFQQADSPTAGMDGQITRQGNRRVVR